MHEGLPLRMAIGLAAGLGLGVLAHALAGDAEWLRWVVANGVEPAGHRAYCSSMRSFWAFHSGIVVRQ